MKKRIAVLLVAVLPWAGVSAQQSVDTTFRVSARVNSVCEISASNLDFGAYTPQNTSPLLGSTLLRATCTPNTTYQIGLNEGTTPGGTISQRKMASSSASILNYQLHSDSARSSIWGNTPGTDTVTGVGTGLPSDHTVFGSVQGSQSVPSGEYFDTITVRLYY